MFPEIDHPTEGPIRHIKVPVKFSKTPGGLRRHAERLGGSSVEVLRELGYSDAQIAESRKERGHPGVTHSEHLQGVPGDHPLARAL